MVRHTGRVMGDTGISTGGANRINFRDELGVGGTGADKSGGEWEER